MLREESDAPAWAIPARVRAAPLNAPERRTTMAGMLPDNYLTLGILAPAILAGVLFLLAGVVPGDGGGPKRGWAATLAVAAGYALGQASAFGGLPDFPAVASDDRIFWLSVFAGTAYAGACWLARWPWARRLLTYGFPFAVPGYLLARTLARREWIEVLLAVGGLGFALAIVARLLGVLGNRRAGASLPLLLWWTTTGGAAALTLAGSAKFGFFAGILAGVMGAAVVVSWLRSDFRLGSGALGVVVAINGALWIAGTWFSDLPDEAAGLLALAPLSAFAAEWGPLARSSPRKAVLVRLGLAALVMAPALYLAWSAAPPPYDAY